jgi:hypothetical protein
MPTPYQAETQLVSFKRQAHETIAACMNRFELLHRSASVLYPANAVLNDHLKIAKLIEMLGPKTRQTIRALQHQSTAINYHVLTYNELLPIATHTETSLGEFDLTHGFIPALSAQHLRLNAIDPYDSDDNYNVRALGLKDLTKDPRVTRANMYKDKGNVQQALQQKQRDNRARIRSKSRERLQRAGRPAEASNPTDETAALPPRPQPPVQHQPPPSEQRAIPMSQPPPQRVPAVHPTTAPSSIPTPPAFHYQEPTQMPQRLDYNSPHHNPSREQQGRYSREDLDRQHYQANRQSQGQFDERNQSPGRENYYYQRQQSPSRGDYRPNRFGSGDRSRPRYGNGASPARVPNAYRGGSPQDYRRQSPARFGNVDNGNQSPIVPQKGITVNDNFNFQNPDKHCTKCGGFMDAKTGIVQNVTSHNDADCRLYVYYNPHKCNTCRNIHIHAHHYERYCKHDTGRSN